jgi:tRNA(Ile)-lysidine synthase
LERRLDKGSAAPLAVALSGGSDSLALLHLTMDWARVEGRPVLALTGRSARRGGR